MEEINFKIYMRGTGWDDVYPECIVSINEQQKWRGCVDPDTVVDFDMTIEEDHNTLTIQYVNRNSNSDVKRDADDNIIANRQIDIDAVCIDDIELDSFSIIHKLSEVSFTDYEYCKLHEQDPQSYPITKRGITTLGTECKWNLQFTTPVYIWMLENL